MVFQKFKLNYKTVNFAVQIQKGVYLQNLKVKLRKIQTKKEQYFYISLICQIKLQSQSLRFEKNMIRSSKHIQAQPKSKPKKIQHHCMEEHTLKHLSPLSKILAYESASKNNSKQKRNGIILRSTRYTSPNSCQSSEIMSKKQSRQKKQVQKSKKNKNGNFQGIKKRKRKNSFEKKNKAQMINNKALDQFKITKWKNKIRKQFIVQIREQVNRNHSINFLQGSLKLYSDQTFKTRTSNSFFGYLLGQGQEDNSRKTMLLGMTRIVTIDWMYLIATSLLLNRQTVHLAVHYLDSYLTQKQQNYDNIHIFAAAALLLSVKQEQRQMQSILLQTVCMSQKFLVLKDQVLQSQKQILTKLNFRLKSNTLAFWIDYFSLKWDAYICSMGGQQAMKQANCNIQIKLRSSDGDCYRLYRQLVQLADVSLMFGDYIAFQKSKLALSCLYLVIRIQTQKANIKNQQKSEDLFKIYHKLFLKKASPIFKDHFRINEIFNSFLTQICEFQMTQIIPCIKFIANFLQIDFCYSIDEKAIEETKSYEDFIRRMTYSYQMKDYCINKFT